MSSADDGGIVNVPFGRRTADTVSMDATIWVLTLADGTRRLLYTQSIDVAFPNRATGETMRLPHMTVNVLREA